MKILHLCFGNEHYIDTWGYQQNLLPLYHAKTGNKVVVLASNDTFPKFVDKNLISKIKSKGNEYFNGPVKVIRSSSFFKKTIKLQKARGLTKRLNNEKPDLIFFHGCINLSILSCVRYKQKNPLVRLVIDNHGDNFNINTNKVYRFIYLKLFWRNLHRYLQKKIDCYYGVTKSRCDFLESYLNIDKSKIMLLPIGADIDTFNSIKESRESLRRKYSFKDDDIIIVHGGKLDKRKGTTDLIKAYHRIDNNKVKLVLFGNLVDKEISPILNNDIVVLEWLTRIQVFELFKLADLAIWPIHHTTLIEDAIAANLPFLIRKTDTTQHLINSDFFLTFGSQDELFENINYFILKNKNINSVFKMRVLDLHEKINYYKIAEKAICMEQ